VKTEATSAFEKILPEKGSFFLSPNRPLKKNKKFNERGGQRVITHLGLGRRLKILLWGESEALQSA